MNKTNLAKPLLLLIPAIVLLVMPAFALSPRLLHILIMVGFAIILATTNRLTFLAGRWHFGQIAFYCIGAYTILLFTTKLGLPFWPCFLLGGVVSGIIALGFGYATSRVKGIYFGILTLAFVEVIREMIIKTPWLGGYRTLSCPAPDPIIIPYLFKLEFTTRLPYYYFILFLVAITITILYMIEKSRVGEIFNTIAQSEPLAESVGIDTVQYKVSAFCICSFFAGIAGAFYASYVTVIGPMSFDVWASIIIWIHMVIGGLGSLWGPAIGAAFLVFLPEVIPGAAIYQRIIFAAIVLLVLFLLPGGIISLPDVIRGIRQKSSERG